MLRFKVVCWVLLFLGIRWLGLSQLGAGFRLEEGWRRTECALLILLLSLRFLDFIVLCFIKDKPTLRYKQ